MKKYVIANWKSHKTLLDAEQWLETFCQVHQPDPQVEVIVAPSFICLAPLWQRLQDNKVVNLALAAQDVSPFPAGSYTGAVAAEMLRGLVDYVLLGHAERRRYFHETNQEVARKVSEALAAGLKPIVCVDQPYLRAQMAALDDTEANDLMIGYGPVEAIGVDLPQAPAKTIAVVDEIRALVPGCPILYGGSIKAENAATYMALAGVSGLLVGSASLCPEEFSRICKVVAQS